MRWNPAAQVQRIFYLTGLGGQSFGKNLSGNKPPILQTTSIFVGEIGIINQFIKHCSQ